MIIPRFTMIKASRLLYARVLSPSIAITARLYISIWDFLKHMHGYEKCFFIFMLLNFFIFSTHDGFGYP